MARSKKSAPESTPETPVQAAPVNEVVESTQEAAEPTLSDAFTSLLTELTNMRTQITSLTSQLRALRSRSEREMRAAQKSNRKRKNPNRKPSGFVKPTLISTEMATFLNKPKGTEMARTEVTREITQYVRTNNLQDPSNGRRILPDAKLRKLLKLSKSDELTYFNLQKYMSPHFAKASQ